jgi:endo-1,4-beta-D-glucanase Y
MSLLLITGCSKDETKPVDTNATIDVAVKDQDGNMIPNIKVHVFHKPATETDGSNPANAVKSAVTDPEGLVSFNLNTLPSGTVYITVLEELLTKEQHVLGSIEVDHKKGEPSAHNLVIDDHTLVYEHGYIPTTITSTLAINEYNRWKNSQVVACNGALRVVSDPTTQTLVEGMGFGMLLSAYAKDKPTFDGLFAFYKSKRTTESKNMMGWKVTCDNIMDPGSATDGDIDVAFSLIVASKQWADQTYLEAAKEILLIVKTNLILTCTVKGESALIVGPGYSNIAWGGCGEMDIMYHTPAFFRVFANVTGDNTWTTLANDTYKTLVAGANATTGLVPDWQTASGTPGPNGRVGYFGYDACRAPWRLTLDYLWNGNDNAEAWSIKIATWAKSVGPTKIVDGYELNGTPIGGNGLNSAFLGGFSVAAMSHSQTTVDNFSTELAKLNDSYWFNLNTRCLYLFTLTGNFWDPLKK